MIDYTYDADLRLGGEVVAGAPVQFGYDADGFLTAAGALSLTRKPENGALAGTTLAGIRDEYTYNELGEVTAYAASYNSTPVLTFNYCRDTLGRITANGDTAYEYDPAGRLARVTVGGAAIAEYDYDTNGNRTAHRWHGGSTTATYDEEDRRLAYGDATYEYTASGHLRTRTVAGQRPRLRMTHSGISGASRCREEPTSSASWMARTGAWGRRSTAPWYAGGSTPANFASSPSLTALEPSSAASSTAPG